MYLTSDVYMIFKWGEGVIRKYHRYCDTPQYTKNVIIITKDNAC